MSLRVLPAMFTLIIIAASLLLTVEANWDPATGHLWDFRPTPQWVSQHPPKTTTKAIQVAECSHNTRLHFPDVQVFAWFAVDHSDDNYHGCPYGTCYAFTDLPAPEDLTPDFTNSDVFFWHKLGGIPGVGTNPIANPQTGGFGYEGMMGKFHDGPAVTTEEQVDHDSNWSKNSLPAPWPSSLDLSKCAPTQGPVQPKCGLPDGPNRDPGQVSGAYGNYTPAPANKYLSPLPISSCSSGTQTSGPHVNPHKVASKCADYCQCFLGCGTNATCQNQCGRSHKKCAGVQCPASS